MFDHIIDNALRLAGGPDLAAASLMFASLDHERHATVNARMIDDDDLGTLARFLEDEGMAHAGHAARTFLDLWERGRARAAVKSLTGVCTVELDVTMPLTGQADQWPAILVQSTITDKDVRDHLAAYEPPIPEDSPEYKRTLERLREYADSDAQLDDENRLIDGCAGI